MRVRTASIAVALGLVVACTSSHPSSARAPSQAVPASKASQTPSAIRTPSIQEPTAEQLGFIVATNQNPEGVWGIAKIHNPNPATGGTVQVHADFLTSTGQPYGSNDRTVTLRARQTSAVMFEILAHGQPPAKMVVTARFGDTEPDKFPASLVLASAPMLTGSGVIQQMVAQLHSNYAQGTLGGVQLVAYCTAADGTLSFVGGGQTIDIGPGQSLVGTAYAFAVHGTSQTCQMFVNGTAR